MKDFWEKISRALIYKPTKSKMAETKIQAILEGDKETILDVLGLSNIPEKDKEEVADALLNHFANVIVENMLINLDEKSIEDFKNAIENGGDKMEEKVMAIAAKTPNLLEKLEDAISKEIELIKAARSAM